MTRVDQAVSGRPAPGPREQPERTQQDVCGRFARCVSRAETGSVLEGPAGEPTAGRTESAVVCAERFGPPEGLGAAAVESGRPQASAPHVETAAPRGPETQAAVLARSLFEALPLAAARERTLTVSFPAAGGAVEQLVVSTSGGWVTLVVTARAQARERVAAALPELARLLRSHGLRVGSVGLA